VDAGVKQLVHYGDRMTNVGGNVKRHK